VIDRLRPREVARLWRADVPGPVDVLNLLRIEHLESYRWYGMLVAPPLAVVGGGPIWMGRLEQALTGEAPADKLLVVRYPSHRRFLAMTLSPYYLAINPLREHGVQRFQAAFTHASVTAPGLRRRRRVVGVHFDGELEPLREAGEARVGPLVYASRETAPIGRILRSPRATDPNPPGRDGFAMFEADEAPSSTALAALEEATTGCEIALYRREPVAAYRPGAPSAPHAARRPQDTSLRSSSSDPAAQNRTA
jgi:uncharacterized protein (DUF1330 family)